MEYSFVDDFTKDETVASGEDASINADFVLDLRGWYPISDQLENVETVLQTWNKGIFYCISVLDYWIPYKRFVWSIKPNS